MKIAIQVVLWVLALFFTYKIYDSINGPIKFNQVKNAFIFTPEMVNQMKSDATLMHPLPRVNEIMQRVDDLPQARYFEQALNGVPVRMSLIAEALGV